MSLIKPDGFVGLLTPSGIYADKTAADFFKSVSTTGRVVVAYSTLRTAKSSSKTFTPRSSSAPSSSAERRGASLRPSAPSSSTIPRLSTTLTGAFLWPREDFARW